MYIRQPLVKSNTIYFFSYPKSRLKILTANVNRNQYAIKKKQKGNPMFSSSSEIFVKFCLQPKVRPQPQFGYINAVRFFFEKQDGTHNLCVVPVIQIVLNLSKFYRLIVSRCFFKLSSFSFLSPQQNEQKKRVIAFKLIYQAIVHNFRKCS